MSLDEIARRAGVGAGTVYRHFASKEALFEAVVFDRIGELVEEARALSDDPDPGRAFSSFVERLGREGARKRDLVEDALPTTESTCNSQRRRSSERSLRPWPKFSRRAQRAGAVRSDISVDDVVALLTGAAYAICHSRADDERTRRLLAIMYDGLRADRTGGEV